MMRRWSDRQFEIHYFYSNKYPGLTAHRFSFDSFDFLDKYYDDNFLDSFHFSNKVKNSSFKFPVGRSIVRVGFVKIKRMFGWAKVFVKITVVGYEGDVMSKGLRVKNQNMAALNEWINKVLEDIESNDR